jgi:Cu(I)/Ag(I) efflux system membrane fusion protein
MNRKILLLVLSVSLAAAIAAGLSGHWYFMMREPAAPAADRKILYWTDPMVPGYRSDKPGKSPFMDMQLVPVYDETAGGAVAVTDGSSAVTIAPEVINRLGVRTERAASKSPTRRIVTEGYVFRDNGIAHVMVDIFEHDADWVRTGLTARVNAAATGERSGRVERVQSDLDIGARSLKATVRVDDPAHQLKSNMVVQVTIEAAVAGKRLLVPREALIRTGTRTAVVRALDGGRFQPVEVTTGEDFGEWTEIRSGLRDGDDVVVSGQFLIDSEASLRASFDRLKSDAAPSPAPPAGHDRH